VMDLSLSAEQKDLVDSVDAMFGRRSTADVVRAAEPLGFDASLWDSVHDLGLLHMAVGERDGGWGASMLDLCLVAESAGRRCAPVPLVETQVALRLLAALGIDSVPAMLDDRTIATIALHPPKDAVARLVPAGAVARLVAFTDDGAVRVLQHDQLPSLVPNHANLPLADVAIEGAETLAVGSAAAARYEAAIDEWLLLTAGTLVGLSAAALDAAVCYACERQAFGQPIGSFQAIAHRLADVATAIDGARLLLYEAACSTESVPGESAERSCMAFAFAADVARDATYWAVHTFGGYGVMVEYDAQLYFRRARGWAGVYGDAMAAYRRVARHRYQEDA
jgi:alkylation response protein AidB-like acyl-CoA dehydrogenase